MQPEIEDASTRAAAAYRPHWALRCVAAFGALLAMLAIALMAKAIVNNWHSAPVEGHVPWLPLTMLASMLALLGSGLALAFRLSNLAIVVFAVSMLIGFPYTLFGLAIAFFSD
jgi:hypothetical protein